jgi:Mn-dependent DtxR family transcriptional regulator
LIFEVRSLQPAEITEIAEALGQSLNTTRDQLRKLIKLDLIIRVPFEHHTLYGINGHFNKFISDILDGLYD